jgi:hypothetical protein
MANLSSLLGASGVVSTGDAAVTQQDDDLIVLLRANMGGTAAAQAAVWIAASSRSA